MGKNPLKGRSEGEDLYGPREVLNELKYRAGVELARATVWYVHRGASARVSRAERPRRPEGGEVEPGDAKAVGGGDVLDVGRSFLKVRDGLRTSQIPLHRVFRIEYDGEAVWERPRAGGDEGAGEA